MFIPVLKFRQSEMRAIKTVVDMLSSDIVPLFEIFQDEYMQRYEVNEETGKFKTRKDANGRNVRIKTKPTKDDIITFDSINDKINGKTAFIDFLRISFNKYKNFDSNAVVEGIKLRKFDYYRERVIGITNHKNFIPVISIQNDFGNNLKIMQSLYDELKTLTNSIAVRITAECYQQYIPLLKLLRKTDYILFDIEETNLKGLRYDIKDFIDNSFVARLILINSPRPRDYFNKDFEECGKTSLINTDVIKSFKELGFEGFGDYCGCRDVLPSPGVAIKGSALSLLYNYEDNAFWVNTNKNTSLGVKGFEDIKPRVMALKSYLDPTDSCLAYKKLASVKQGIYATWIELCIIRYINQLYDNLTSWN